MKKKRARKYEATELVDLLDLEHHSIYVALAGNPNSGKTSLFNALTGDRQKTANYGGVTVEIKVGKFRTSSGRQVNVIDLPGLYSLATASREEELARDAILGRHEGMPRPDVTVVVVDATNLERHLYLAAQIAETGMPTVVALNMIDVARKRDLRIDSDELAHELGVPVIETVASRREGVAALLEVLDHLHAIGVPPRRWQMDHAAEHVIGEVAQELVGAGLAGRSNADWSARRTLFGDGLPSPALPAELQAHITEHRKAIPGSDDDLLDSEVVSRYNWIRQVTKVTVTRPPEEQRTRSELIDRLVLHPVAGPAIFALLMAAVFQAIFLGAQWSVGFSESVIADSRTWLGAVLPPGELRDLISDGILSGVGSLIIFLPQIVLLFFFIVLLEESGYMSRAAFLMDRLMRRVGLSGRAFIPLLSSLACAVPGILAARSVRDRRARITAILVAPLMTCSGRLPIYTLFISAFYPEVAVFGFLSSRGLILTGLYLGGILVTLAAAWTMRRWLLPGGIQSFMQEMPSYSAPRPLFVAASLWQITWEFVRHAGALILVISVIIWFLSTHPKVETTPVGAADDATQWRGRALESSYIGQFGRALEPVLKPLGFNWKIGVGLMTSFVSRELIISTLGTIYAVDNESGARIGLRQALREEIDPETGRPLWTPLVVASLLAFFVFACLCMSTVATVFMETRSLRWPAFVVLYTFALAYLASLAVYQGGMLMGLS